jgi:hypothetical protein
MGDVIPRMDTEGLAGRRVIEEEYLALSQINPFKIADMVGNEDIHVLLDMAKKKPVSTPRIIQRLADDSTRQGGIHGQRQSPEYAGAH